jgi:hypothetical protein
VEFVSDEGEDGEVESVEVGCDDDEEEVEDVDPRREM